MSGQEINRYGLPQDIEDTLVETGSGVSFEVSLKTINENAEKERSIRKIVRSYKKPIDSNEDLDPFPYWGIYGFEPTISYKNPISKSNFFSNLNFTDEEKNGVLTKRIVACFLNQLVKDPMTKKLVLATVDLSYKVK